MGCNSCLLKAQLNFNEIPAQLVRFTKIGNPIKVGQDQGEKENVGRSRKRET